MKAISGWLAKKGRGFIAADENFQKIHSVMADDECAYFKYVKVRDPAAFRRYWKLMTICAENCEQIVLDDGAVLAVKTKQDVHTAVKLCTGHYDTLFDTQNRPIARIVKSTSFEEMEAEEWDEYWPRVLDVVEERVLPGVSLSALQHEIRRCMGTAR